MKYLKIENGKGYYWNGQEEIEIDKINKDDLLALLNYAESDDFEMDEYDENMLQNKAHQIIYENLYHKLKEFLNDKEQFKREVEELYKAAINKYSAELKDEGDGNSDAPEGEGSSEEINPEDIPF